MQYYIAVWAISFLEAYNKDYLTVPDPDRFDETMGLADVVEVVKHYSDLDCSILPLQDIFHNAVATSISYTFQKVEQNLFELDQFIRLSDQASRLRAYLRYLKLIYPSFQLCGDGTLENLRVKYDLPSLKGFVKSWLRNVHIRIEFLKGIEGVMTFPNSQQDILPSGLSLEKPYFSAISISKHLMNLCYQMDTESTTGILISAKGVPSFKILAEDFSRTSKRLISAYEQHIDLRNHYSLDYLDDWSALLESTDKLLKTLHSSYYDLGESDADDKDRNERIQRIPKDIRKVRFSERNQTDNNIHF